MNDTITALVRTAVADLEPRIVIAQQSVYAAEAALADASANLADLTAQRDQLLAGLPTQPDTDTAEGDDEG